MSPWCIEIVGWCPAGSVLPHGKKTPFSHPSSDAVTIKIPYGVDVLSHQPASHFVFSDWVG